MPVVSPPTNNTRCFSLFFFVFRCFATSQIRLTLTQLSLRSPYLSSMTFFASDEVLLRFRPLFFAVVSATLLKSTKVTTGLNFVQMPCQTLKETNWCESKPGSDFVECKNLVDSFKISKRQLEVAVYDDMEKFLRKNFLDPLKEKENEFMTDNIYQRYIFAASKHSGKHMNKLLAWVYNHEAKRFERDDTLELRPIDGAVLGLSFGMILISMVIIVIKLNFGMKLIEKQIISSTLLNDPEVLKDLRSLVSFYQYFLPILFNKGILFLPIRTQTD